MRFMKILILILSVIFVTNCSGSKASDPQMDLLIKNFVEDGNSEKDAKCLAFRMKNQCQKIFGVIIMIIWLLKRAMK